MANTTMHLPNEFGLTATGLRIKGAPTFRAWKQAGRTLIRLHNGSSWAIGDWLVWGGEQSWGEKYARAIAVTQRRYSTLANLKYVSRTGRRLETRSFKQPSL